MPREAPVMNKVLPDRLAFMVVLRPGKHNRPMPSAWFDNIVAWISAHPVAAGGLIFLVAFCDALAVVGIVVPALPLLFAVGVLVGLGHIYGPYALACAALGALLGDALSFWIGRRWGPHLREHWPFRRYPQLLDRGEALFRRHGAKGIVIARYVGAVRPFVPAVAGMLRMPIRRYLPPSVFAAATWAAIFLAPGWIFGASYDAVAAVADRLALVLLALLAVLALAWAAVLYGWRWFAGHADTLLGRALRWSRRHPRFGRYTQSLIDPNRPESASLALLAACLLAIGWAWFALLALVLARGGPLLLDQSVYAAMATLRNPLADQLMAALATLGDAQVLLPAAGMGLAWLLWRRRWIAAAHWLAALAFGLALTAGLDAWIDMPRPPGAPAGFGFPSIAVTMATITLGFFAVLVARALPGRRRVWPYIVGGAVVAMIGFARLYLGAHWLSDVVGGILLGIAWLLVLGLAYRSHVSRPLYMRPLAVAFYGTFALAGGWHAVHAADPLLARFETPVASTTLDVDGWWNGDAWQTLPAQRNERDAGLRWPLDVQVAGPLAPLRAALQARGWQVQAQADWIATLGLLDDDRVPAVQPVLPATLDAEAEVLLLRRPGPAVGDLQVLRLWRAPAQLADGAPLWLGTSQAMHYTRPFDMLALWQPRADAGAAHAAVRDALQGLRVREAARDGIEVIRVDTRP
jgi:membrane protein DedA with SNARE-associated domain/membrane-associated phospholipid phosphatase